MNRLYYGDNLDVLRNMGENKIENESVDLIYLDPPFNSKRDYNLLFKSPGGAQSESQITAFDDTWHWGEQSQREFDEILHQPNTAVAGLMNALFSFLGANDMMAYLTMMCNRLLELHRVLKPTGTLYLHSDPTASHYLKIILDGVFGKENFRNEISWTRSQPKSHTTVNFPNCRDVIFRYAKTDRAKFKKVYGKYNEDYLKKFYRYVNENGKRYSLGPLTNPAKKRDNLTYEFLGVKRVWRWTKERMEQAYKDGIIYQAHPGAVPRQIRYLDDMLGQPVTDNWNDIEHLHGSHDEFLGYPTQKPVALLERIIEASSDEGDVVLDPFCGCGTAIHAAQKLNRRWLGIDITHLAISLIENRLNSAFENIKYEVVGAPKDLQGAINLAERDKYQFQWWACSLVGAQPSMGHKKGADKGIDGVIYFQDELGPAKKIVVSIKGGENVSVTMIRDLKGVMEREKSPIGLFVTLYEPTRAMIEEAATAGMYRSPATDKPFPKLQILTVDGLLRGFEKPYFKDLTRGRLTFKSPKKEKLRGDNGAKDMFSSKKKKTTAQ